MSLVLHHDDSTGLHMASDGTYLFTARGGEQSKPGVYDVDIVDLRMTPNVETMTAAGRVHLCFGQSTWVGITPNRAMLYLGDTFLSFLEHNHKA